MILFCRLTVSNFRGVLFDFFVFVLFGRNCISSKRSFVSHQVAGHSPLAMIYQACGLKKPDGVLCAVPLCLPFRRATAFRGCSRLWQTAKPIAVLRLRRRTLRVLIPSEKNKNPPLLGRILFFGDPDGIRTRVTAVKGRCLRPLDHRAAFGGCSWIRTNDTPGMNRML